MTNGIFKILRPDNESTRQYRPGSEERKNLKKKLDELASEEFEIPLIIGGEEIRTGDLAKNVMPHDHRHVLATYHQAHAEHLEMAVEASKKAYKEWSDMTWQHRAAVFMKAAELLAGPYRDIINGATMLGQSKNVFQAEIDAACESIDYLRFNIHFMSEILSEQPTSLPQTWNRMDFRPLEGFVFAITPFNFTSIAINLPTSPAMIGNTVLWKPASSTVYTAYFIMKLLEEAGLPPGVINFVPGRGSDVGSTLLKHHDLAGVHFTGSTAVFRHIWKTVGNNIENYKVYPRLVGETGGKDFIFAHESADPKALATAIIRGSFEYQGQKCSAASRSYIPAKIWPDVKDILMTEIPDIKMGDVRDFSNFMGAVIDNHAYDTISGYLDYTKESNDAEIILGGDCHGSKGYFIEPTIIVTSNPGFKTMQEEIFGPVMTIYPYETSKYEETLHICDQTSPYALTGSIFANDRSAIQMASRILRNAAGNFYINDKPTGAMVGQQPFGGARASGTNDKAGSHLNLHRWISLRTIKENFLPPTDYRYPHMDES